MSTAMELYPPYRVKPATVTDSGSRFERLATSLTTVAGNVRTAGGQAECNVCGVLSTNVSQPARTTAQQGDGLSKASMVASGGMTLWSRAIETYNTDVAGLRQQWSAAAGNDFGVEAADYSDANNAEERQSVRESRNTQISAARAELKRRLDRKQQGYLETLRDEARQVATVLRKGDSEDNVRNLLIEGALPASALTLFSDINLTDAQLAKMRRALAENGDLSTYFTPPKCGASAAQLRAMLDAARGMGLEPAQYKDLLQQYYVTKAAEKAGINMCAWDPSKGAEANREIIESVYTYYGDLYLDNPNLKWAGMANMIGPSFAAGFFDLEMFRDIADGATGPLDNLPDEVRDSLPFPINEIGKLSELTQEDIAFYEETFLQMQKDIFIDQAGMHEAYLEGGMDAIHEMEEAGLFDNEANPGQTADAWSDIDEGIRTGDQDMINAGNEGLLYREQHDIIDDAYQQMYDHGPTGPAMTYLMGVVGDPSIPGAKPLAEVDPLDFTADINGPLGVDLAEIHVDTPLPEGNIADFDTRWGLIEDDTLPAYLEMVDNNPDEARDIIGSDVHDRIEDNRIIDRVPEIVNDFGTNWNIDIDWF